MLFNSLDFLVFFPLVTLLYFVWPHRWRWLHLLIASCVFYMFFIPAYILILFFTITIDYIAGIVIEQSTGGRRKFFLILSLAGNLGVLAVFKYAGFFVAQANWLLHVFGSGTSIRWWDIVLPIGLSFHTFQAMSYTIEVYRGNYRAERHFGLYALYVMFYPQLVAGPIERPWGLLRQLRERHVLNRPDLAAGLRLMLWGFFKKLVIADRISVYVSYVYGNVDHLSWPYVLLAVLLFSFQVYCDFSGYSDIAIGAARIMGFRLMVNFNRPYFAGNIREFWARWHISLTSWFRDYVYIPLGGNRRGRKRTYLNVIIVFLLSGFWHGAGWNFIIWGGLNALLMVIWMFYTGMGRTRHPVSLVKRGLSVAGTFLLVSIMWVFFRAENVGQAFAIFGRLAGHRAEAPFRPDITRTSIALSVVFIAGMLVVEKLTTPQMEEMQHRFWPDIVFCTLVLSAILLFGVFSSQPFIYFQF